MSSMKPKKKKSSSGGFQSFKIHPPIFKSIAQQGFAVPTPIQRRTIPLLMNGHDVVAMARTGSGKTLAFLIPLLHQIQTHEDKHKSKGARSLILAPTRELAMQTFTVAKKLAKFTNIEIGLLIGGDSLHSQFDYLDTHAPDIIIATPGRLLHCCIEIPQFTLRCVRFIIIDEADQLFEMGFAHQLREIFHRLHTDGVHGKDTISELESSSSSSYSAMPNDISETNDSSLNSSAISTSRQIALFSATLPSALVEFTRTQLRDPQMIQLDIDHQISPNCGLYFFLVRKEQKLAALMNLLENHIDKNDKTIIFTSHRHSVELLQLFFASTQYSATYLYGTLDPMARKINIAKFRAGKASILLVTDIAARGVDLPTLDNVINFDFPARSKLFIHRVGRVARAGRSGRAFSLVSSDELPYVLDLSLYLSRAVHSSVGTLTPTQAEAPHLSPDILLFGTFPPDELDEHADELMTGLALQHQVRVCQRADKLYYKTRPAASHSSITRSKNLLGQLFVHPFFVTSSSSSSGSTSHVIDTNSSSTKEIASPASTVPVKSAIPSYDSQSRESFLHSLHSYAPSSTIFDIINKNDKHASMMKLKRADHQLFIQKEKIKNKILQKKGEYSEFLKVNSGNSATQPSEGNSLDFENPTHSMDIEETLEDIQATVKSGNQKTNKRTFAQLSDEDNEDSNPTLHTPRISKKARKELKKRPNASSNLPASIGIDNDYSREHTASSQEQARSLQFYLAPAPNAKPSSDNSLQVSSDLLSSTFSHLSASTLDLMGDEQSTLLQSKDVLKWNKRKKKFLRETVHSDPFHGQRDEKGELVRVKGENQYEKWRKLRNKRRAKTAGTVDFDDDDGEGDENNQGHKNKSMKKPIKKGPVRNELKSVDEIRKHRKVQQKKKFQNAPKKSTKGHGARSGGRTGGKRK